MLLDVGGRWVSGLSATSVCVVELVLLCKPCKRGFRVMVVCGLLRACMLIGVEVQSINGLSSCHHCRVVC